MYLPLVWTILRILVRYRWIAQSDVFFVVVVMESDLGVCVWPFALVLVVRLEYVLPARVFGFVGIL